MSTRVYELINPKPKAERHTKMIKRDELMIALEHLKPNKWSETDFRKNSAGKVVRFVNWSRGTR